MKLFIGADHNGFQYMQQIAEYLKKSGHEVVDKTDGTFDPEDDFPVFAGRVAAAVLAEADTRGVLVCGSGQGMVMAANRFPGIRAGLGWCEAAARSSRNDEDSNVISLPSTLFGSDDWQKVLDVWLQTPFAKAERFIRRNREMDNLVS